MTDYEYARLAIIATLALGMYAVVLLAIYFSGRGDE